ncbi:MAG: Fe3+/spermidine/putrescine ABC transporter ATP-binding protein [Rhizobiales bacterium PAR1]|nr:MAG: Fe3+/spermidine/putrescine ABC transporter ATP-binding protein [Rhizobiales bacterium PAR1]
MNLVHQTPINTTPPDLVRFEGVRKSYDGIHFVVDDLNLSVRKGEFLTMLGPSGSGKTTTLMMLGGFERPTLGHILLDGRPVERLPPEKRNIGFVFQNYALFPHMTVAENIAFPLQCRKITGAAAETKVKAALERVQLGAFGNRKPVQLSGGQQQRVALARALVFEPSLVLMDEPLGALDKQLREHMQVEIKHLQQSLGITMVYVTHDQSEALTMSDRIAVFHDGRIQQLDGPRRLYDCPSNRFVAGFIGESNLVDGLIDGFEGGEAIVRAPDGAVLRAPAVEGAKAGMKVTVLIRPERMAVHNADGPERQNIVRGLIREIFFLGDHLRLSIAALGLDELLVRIPAAQGEGLVANAEVELAFAISDARILTA